MSTGCPKRRGNFGETIGARADRQRSTRRRDSQAGRGWSTLRISKASTLSWSLTQAPGLRSSASAPARSDVARPSRTPR